MTVTFNSLGYLNWTRALGLVFALSILGAGAHAHNAIGVGDCAVPLLITEFNLVDVFHALNDSTPHRVLAIKKRRVS